MGYVCREGKTSVPSIVRVGLNIHHSVAKVSLENLMQQKLDSKMESKVCLLQAAHNSDRRSMHLEETDAQIPACVACPLQAIRPNAEAIL